VIPLLSRLTILAVMLIGLPMLGVHWAGLPIPRYLEFPPQTLYVQHAPFSWSAFAVFCTIILAAVIPLALMLKHEPDRRESGRPDRSAFPWWGWIGTIMGLLAWMLAWSRFPWFERFQPHTFTPLWLSYILVVNGLTYRRTAHCLMVDRPGHFLVLFPVSAVFWWFFEYLNRFVQNWHYTGVQFSPWEYFWYATLPFMTVLPAVLSTREWICPRIGLVARATGFSVSSYVGSTGLACIVLLVSAAGLVGIGIWPDYLFPLLWLSPLLIIVSLQELMGDTHILSELSTRGWGSVVSAVLAALFCGFFWEMWNYYSFARWEYHVPFVDRFHIFEMPILGYAGYLPFGLECAVIDDLVEGRRSVHKP